MDYLLSSLVSPAPPSSPLTLAVETIFNVFLSCCGHSLGTYQVSSVPSFFRGLFGLGNKYKSNLPFHNQFAR